MSDSGHDTSGGVKLTAEQLDALVEEAERGYDTDRLRSRSRRGRPPLDAQAATVFHVRLPPALRHALEQAADDEQTTPSQIVRQALADYLDERPA
ncbi:MAG: ribbon-helix-helix protein, CopG family [Egibacteraceae bacterium]